MPISYARDRSDPSLASPDGVWVWWSALALFIVAGGTGALFRFGMVYGVPGGLTLENIRHAHSHLMYFGWGTPALMVLIWRCLPTDLTMEWERVFRWVAGSTVAAAILAYPPFLLFGYSSVQIGAAQMPIAVVGAGLNILGWYGFVALYIAVTHRRPRRGALRLWDVAVGALVLATLGAWSLSLIPLLGMHNPLIAQGLTHVFLDLFSEGWFVLGALGVAYASLQPRSGPAPWSVWVVVLGLPFTFILGLPVDRLSMELELAGRAGGMLVAIGLLALTLPLAGPLTTRRNRWLWDVPLACLLLKATAQLVGSLGPGLWLGASHGLRIFYLHLMLLGFFSLALAAGAQARWTRQDAQDLAFFYGTIGLVLLTLVPLTAWIPGGRWAYEIAAWAALGPVFAAAWMLGRGLLPVRGSPALASVGTDSS